MSDILYLQILSQQQLQFSCNTRKVGAPLTTNFDSPFWSAMLSTKFLHQFVILATATTNGKRPLAYAIGMPYSVTSKCNTAWIPVEKLSHTLASFKVSPEFTLSENRLPDNLQWLQLGQDRFWLLSKTPRRSRRYCRIHQNCRSSPCFCWYHMGPWSPCKLQKHKIWQVERHPHHYLLTFKS